MDQPEKQKPSAHPDAEGGDASSTVDMDAPSMREPEGVAESIEDLPAQDGAAVMENLSTAMGADVAEYLDPGTASKILSEMDPTLAASVIADMEVPEASLV